jgi:hypothetical protein
MGNFFPSHPLPRLRFEGEFVKEKREKGKGKNEKREKRKGKKNKRKGNEKDLRN